MSTCEPTYPPGLPCDSVLPTPAAEQTPAGTPVPMEPAAGTQLVDTGAGISPWLVVLAVAVIIIGLILWRVTK